MNVINDESVLPEGIDDIYMRSLYLKVGDRPVWWILYD